MSSEKQRNWLKISCMGCGLLPCIVLMISFWIVKGQIGRLGDRLPGELAKLKKMGVPTEPADLHPNPPIPNEKNSASLYRELLSDLSNLKKHSRYKTSYAAISNRLTSANLAHPDIVRGLKLVEPLISKADRLPNYPYLDFRRDYNQGINLLFAEYADLKELCKWQAIRSRAALRNGDYAASHKALASGFAMADHLSQEPAVIGVLVAIALDAIVSASLKDHMQAIKSNSRELDRLRGLLESLSPSFDLKRSLSGELVIGRTYLRDMKSFSELSWSEEYSAQDPIDRLTIQDPAVKRMFDFKYVEQWRMAFEDFPADGHDWKGIGKAMAALEKRVELDNSAQGYLNKILLPIFAEFGKSAGVMESRRRLSLLCVRLLQDRQRGLPINLQRYGKLGIDPLDGNPFRFKIKPNGFVIWGLGRNLMDDGGVEFVPNTGMSSQNVDEVFRFEFAGS